jgi:Alw26I/Eco31I/Esp3I family type II restriction m6 adenine DNA methyltransferase
LFEPLADYDWRKTDIVLPNRLFTNKDRFDDFSTGTGLLDMFDRYNFTVSEAEPLEKEVAIDPEMLGKVFENLIEENLRKGLGSYYTPREIVHYMCQESLINYLDTALNSAHETIGREKRKQAEFGDEKSEQKLLASPTRRELVPRVDVETFVHLGDQASFFEDARVSGTKSYSRHLPKSIENHARLIDDKLADITICDPAVGSGAFPVGMMSEIVRARSTLTPYFNDVHDRTPYHFKRHAIQNCLYGVDIDPGAIEIAKLRLWLSLVVDEEDVKRIKPLPNLGYKLVIGDSLSSVERTLFNKDQFQRLEKLKPLYFDATETVTKSKLKREIDDLIHQLTPGKENFDFGIYFSEIFHARSGFDVAIANPPYGLINKRQNKHESILLFAEQLERLKSSSEFAPARGGMINIFRPFVVRSINILAPRGCFCEIFPLAFACDASAAALRKHVMKNHALMTVEAFPERDDQNKRVFESVKMSVCITTLLTRDQSRDPFGLRIHHDRYVDQHQEKIFLTVGTIETLDSTNYTIPLLNRQELAIIESVYKRASRLADVGHCYTGEIDLTHNKMYLSQNEDDAVLLKGAILDRYRIRTSMSQGEILFLNAKRYLRENHGDRSEHHKRRRIVMQGITGVNERIRLKMTIADEGVFCANSVNYIALRDSKVIPEYLLGLLNSRLLNFVFSKTSTNSNVNGYEVDNLPIVIADHAKQQSVARLTSRVLAAKQRNGEADTNALEREIEQLVYGLYGLTREEIDLVEASSAK